MGPPRITRPAQPDSVFRGWLALLLILVTALHVALCVWVHYDRAWQGDELGSYLAFRDSYRHLLTHFGGWQTMNFYLAGLKAIHDARGGANWLLVAPGIVCGAWLVWLTAGLALRFGSGRPGALVAALLVAVNPFLVRYSLTIRSYIFLAGFSAAMMLSLLAWRTTGRWRDGILAGLFGALALLAHLNATYTYVAAATLAVWWTIIDGRRREPGRLTRLWRLALPVVAFGALAGAAYIPQLPDILRFREIWSDTPPTSLAFLPHVFSRFFGAGFLLLPTLVILLYAAWRACRDDRGSQWMLLAVIIVVGSISLAGASHFPWAYSRFLVATLPWLLVVLADGLAVLATQRRVIATAILLTVGLCNLAALGTERQNLHARPWHRLSRDLRNEMSAEVRCVVIGPVVLLTTAMQVYGVPCSGDVAGVLAGLPPDKQVRLALVHMPAAVFNTLPTRDFGHIRLTAIAGPPQTVGMTLSRELIDGANGRIADDLADVYQQVAGLLRWTGHADAATKYDLLADKCRVQGRRSRNRPPQFFRDQSSGADFGKNLAPIVPR